MATITITVPDAQADRIADACGWNASVAANLPGETKPQFIKRMVATLIKRQVSNYESDKLRAAIAAPPVLDVT